MWVPRLFRGWLSVGCRSLWIFRVLRGAVAVEEAKQHGGLRAELRDTGIVGGRGQLRCGFQSLGGLGSHDIRHTALAQLTPHCLGGTGTDR